MMMIYGGKVHNFSPFHRSFSYQPSINLFINKALSDSPFRGEGTPLL